ncbi:MAG: hypothetical protein M1817_001509 [Caeruleum heppii]|nr:MAG: hypothetical protein M1817_001509 [Caeruleum heppii]
MRPSGEELLYAAVAWSEDVESEDADIENDELPLEEEDSLTMAPLLLNISLANWPLMCLARQAPIMRLRQNQPPMVRDSLLRTHLQSTLQLRISLQLMLRRHQLTLIPSRQLMPTQSLNTRSHHSEAKAAGGAVAAGAVGATGGYLYETSETTETEEDEYEALYHEDGTELTEEEYAECVEYAEYVDADAAGYEGFESDYEDEDGTWRHEDGAEYTQEEYAEAEAAFVGYEYDEHAGDQAHIMFADFDNHDFFKIDATQQQFATDQQQEQPSVQAPMSSQNDNLASAEGYQGQTAGASQEFSKKNDTAVETVTPSGKDEDGCCGCGSCESCDCCGCCEKDGCCSAM